MTQPEKNNLGSEVRAQKSFSIGQIVYILSNNGQTLLPAMVVEESIVKNLDGVTSSWKLAIGKSNDPNKAQKIVDSTKIKGEIYSSLEDVQVVLHERLTGFIKGLLNDTKRREQLWYGQVKKSTVETRRPKSMDDSDQIDPNDLMEEFESVSQDRNTADAAENNFPTKPTKEQLRSKIVEMATAEPTSTSTVADYEDSTSFIIEGPDGSKIPVKVNV